MNTATALDKVVDPETRRHLHDHVAGLMRLVYDQQGIRALESTRRIAAVHEAGHAVVFEATADGVRPMPGAASAGDPVRE